MSQILSNAKINSVQEFFSQLGVFDKEFTQLVSTDARKYCPNTPLTHVSTVPVKCTITKAQLEYEEAEDISMDEGNEEAEYPYKHKAFPSFFSVVFQGIYRLYQGSIRESQYKSCTQSVHFPGDW